MAEARAAEQHEAHAVGELAAVRLHSVDVLRALAALAVVWFHMPPVGIHVLEPVQRTGFAGVNLFLVISGFAIHYIWAARGDSASFSVPAFWRRRLWRLYPTYIAVVVIAVVYAVATHDVGHSMTRNWPLGGGEVPDALLIGGQLLLVGAGMLAVPFVEVAWTLGLELQLYAAYSAFARRLRAIGPVRLVAIAFGVAVAWRLGSMLILDPGPGERLLNAPRVHARHLYLLNQIPGRWFEWMLGLLAAEAWFGRVRLPWWCRRVEVGAVLLVAAYLVTRHPAGAGEVGGRGYVATEIIRDPLYGLAFFVLLNWLIRLELRRPALLTTPPAAALASVGIFSYSLYLLHTTAISVFSHVFAGHPGASVLWYLGALAASLASAWVFFRLVESRFLRLPSARPAGGERWAIQDSNLGPLPYQRSALTD